ncbi:hypothetical protein [Methanolobus sp. WCC4]|uniref:hypothetical protein n=1 Tax=Methanolobus sp. WCC4 TaxID=3125784 RepID=UPI0030F5F66F
MSSRTLSDGNKKADRSPKVFTPNIYRKPIVKEENEAASVASSVTPQSYVPRKDQEQGNWPAADSSGRSDNDPNINSNNIPAFDIDGFVRKEAELLKIRQRYELEIGQYEEKQKELDKLRSEFSEQEKALNKKCAILKSAMERTEKSISKEQKEGLDKEIAEFEQKRSEFEKSLQDHEKEYAEYDSGRKELSSLKSAYEAELEEYTQKKAELDKQCRSLEEKFASEDELSIDLAEDICPAAIDALREGYYAELKELNRKRSDIEIVKTQLEDAESLLAEKRSAVERTKGHLQVELTEIGNRAKELENSVATYEENLKVHEEKELSFQDKVKAFEEKRSEFKAEREKIRLEHEENLKACEKTFEERKAEFKAEREKLKLEHEESIRTFEETFEAKKAEMKAERERLELEHEKHIKEYEEKENVFQQDMRSLEARNTELEAENKRLDQKREDNSKFESEMEKVLAEMEAKRKELDEMVEKTAREIGTQVTIHRQNLDIKKLNTKLEQQSIYIHSLESSIAELKRDLEGAMSDAKKNEVFSQILKTNIELIH